jgi:beta-mannosidase
MPRLELAGGGRGHMLFPVMQSLRLVRFGLVLSAAVPLATGFGREVIPLDQGWEFRQSAGHDAAAPAAAWHPAVVPGDVHLDLLRNQLIPDPFYRDNESKLQWIETVDWEYRTTITLAPEFLSHRRIELVFDGLDATCEVFLNGQRVLTADNMFRTWRADVQGLLKPGRNELRISFPAPAKPAAAAAAGDRWKSRIGTEDKTYIRKAAYEFGWDWGPRFVTSGIWRPVRLDAWDEARISDLHIRQRDVTAEVAHLVGEVEVTASVPCAAEVRLRVDDGSRPVELARTVQLHPGVNFIDVPADIVRPRLWYPAGYGAQPLYAFEARVRVADRVADVRTVRTGLRAVELRRERDQWGRSFEFVINGIPVFAKGANVIPFDSFPNRVTTAQYRRVLESARTANMNMIRHWGGGYYETDEFYEICDELGLMVWQDCMFGNDWQPGLYEFKLNVAREIEDQVRRLRNHPSIVLWCGNNETEGRFFWETKRRVVEPEAQTQMWKDYLTLFYGVIGQTVRRLAPETPYWSSSPTTDFEEMSPAHQTGDFHDWSVWHGRVPFADYEKNVYRFVSEYGFQSFPDLKTVEAFTLPEDRTGILTSVMLAHQKNQQGNAIIRDYLLRDYLEPKDFASFLYVSQVLQAEGIKIGAEHLRRNRPRTMGSLYWQLNDCWPVASWSSLDYFGRWKALQYYARRFYAPLLVSPHLENGAVAVYVVSDRTEPVAGRLRVRPMTLSGETLSERTEAIEIPALSSRIYAQLPLAAIDLRGHDRAAVFVSTDLEVGGEIVARNLSYLQPTKAVRLPRADLTAEVVPDGTGAVVRLSSKVLARSVQVTLGDLPADVSDNYFDLLPGETVAIRIIGADAEAVRRALQVRSLADAFDPPAR